MADTFRFELVSPERLLLSGDADSAVLPATAGDMGIFHSHAPVMTTLRPGLLRVEMGNGETAEFFVRGGFADITPDAVTVLAEYSVARRDLTPAIIMEQRRLGEAEVEAARAGDDDERKANAQGFLDQLNHMEPTIMPL